jgi:hypothetical protein
MPMDGYVTDHDWELVEQAYPQLPKPFGFICCCGAGAVATFANAREAIRAAKSHLGQSSAEPRAA